MNIEITRPEIESLIHQRLQSGAFTDAQDVILQARYDAAYLELGSLWRLAVASLDNALTRAALAAGLNVVRA
ncbi:MAG: hypothetical protein ABSH42_03745 [Bryobacteraceae bacterium]|jgi:hypothetical protein